MSNKEYAVCNNKVYEKVVTKLYTTYKPCKVPKTENVAPLWQGAPIPFDMWKDIVDWCVLSFEKFKSETLIFLYYDLNNADKPWSFWIPPQKTNGMTVKSDPDSKFFAEERKNYPDTMFGTVHHHCSSSAFQSGTDHTDELDREGLHFTIGNVNKPSDLDLHLRITIGDSHGEADANSVIQADPNIQKCYENLQTHYQSTNIKQAFDILHESSIRSASSNYKKREKEFAKHYHKVTKPVTTHIPYNTNSSLGYSYNEAYQKRMLFDESDDYWSVKKTEVLEKQPKDDTTTCYDIAEDLLANVIMTQQIDVLRVKYVTEYLEEIECLTMYHEDELKLACDIASMLDNQPYLRTVEGNQLKDLLLEYANEEWVDYEITIDTLLECFNEYLDDNPSL